jgi:hypothetical protein
MGIIKNYHGKKWTLQFLDALYNSIDIDFPLCTKILLLPPSFSHNFFIHCCSVGLLCRRSLALSRVCHTPTVN